MGQSSGLMLSPAVPVAVYTPTEIACCIGTVCTFVVVQGSGVLECAACLLVCVVCVCHVLMFH